ncbi:MAG TPA: uracil-DNA glycosylase [Mycobacteriales bacterium]|jgi:DNA polymerase|nr:uracil-DNA glycosylase [Mycobacteriales bacterium]
MSPRTIDPSVADIAERAGRCADLPALAETVSSCTACVELAATRHHVVVGDTRPAARLLIVGEAPGANEDEVGRPFVGKGGQLLDALLADAGLDRAEVSVLNVLKCRPPANRTPTRPEANRCTGWLDRQLELLDPPVVLTLGRTALTWAVGTAATLAAMRGQVHAWRGRGLVVSYHPSAALRFGPRGEPHLALAEDLRFVAKIVSSAGGSRLESRVAGR